MQHHIENLHHPNLQTRLEAASALMTGRAIGPLLGALEHRDDEVRWRSAAILGWLENPRVVPALLNMLPGASYEVKFNAMWALGQIADSDIIEPLTALIRAPGDADPDIRYLAALALARLGEVDILHQSLDDGESAYRVAHAALATFQYM
jgi:HEAT repeat protein